MISLEKSYILTSLQKLPNNVRDLGKLIAAKGFKTCPKCKKSPNLVTLGQQDLFRILCLVKVSQFFRFLSLYLFLSKKWK